MSTLREAGERLVATAEEKFPPLTSRCLRCGFRQMHHEPSNHAYEPPVDPFVEALREFVEQVVPMKGSRE